MKDIIFQIKVSLAVLFALWGVLAFLVARHIYWVPCSYTGGGF